MIPARFAPALVGLILSGLMSCIVTLVATVKTLGLNDEVFPTWLNAWLFGWPIAFAVVLIAGPAVRGLVSKWVKSSSKV
ncbi:hypothetical protein MED193_15227 [Roseobacter sp. MED193]|uniref:DUF2798 domain-containing protein n=1 Tax=Roseobacter sp. MED193 TaxID=314262 RepID=UPI000068C20A|nr:DUF2798 domain-containing protein [Roseobacter sp. MED193]EAQ46559.1 hypothetical protein MED193_15227 [Roseobacter sp. MED193]